MLCASCSQAFLKTNEILQNDGQNLTRERNKTNISVNLHNPLQSNTFLGGLNVQPLLNHQCNFHLQEEKCTVSLLRLQCYYDKCSSLLVSFGLIYYVQRLSLILNNAVLFTSPQAGQSQIHSVVRQQAQTSSHKRNKRKNKDACSRWCGPHRGPIATSRMLESWCCFKFSLFSSLGTQFVERVTIIHGTIDLVPK